MEYSSCHQTNHQHYLIEPSWKLRLWEAEKYATGEQTCHSQLITRSWETWMIKRLEEHQAVGTIPVVPNLQSWRTIAPCYAVSWKKGSLLLHPAM
jgi:hypothetical protein